MELDSGENRLRPICLQREGPHGPVCLLFNAPCCPFKGGLCVLHACRAHGTVSAHPRPGPVQAQAPPPGTRPRRGACFRKQGSSGAQLVAVLGARGVGGRWAGDALLSSPPISRCFQELGNLGAAALPRGRSTGGALHPHTAVGPQQLPYPTSSLQGRDCSGGCSGLSVAQAAVPSELCRGAGSSPALAGGGVGGAPSHCVRGARRLQVQEMGVAGRSRKQRPALATERPSARDARSLALAPSLVHSFIHPTLAVGTPPGSVCAGGADTVVP